MNKNIRLNAVADRVSLHQLALGNRNGDAKLHVSEESNWHSFNRIKDHSSSISVEMMTVDRFLSEQELSPDAVDVIRFDLEGFEVELFQAMDQVLDSDPPLLLFVELHPSFREAHELNRILDQLEENDFEIVSTTLDVYGGRFDQGWAGMPGKFNSFDELRKHQRESNVAVELIARKG